jgi:hypothetical protein
MSRRAEQLHDRVDRQVSELLRLLNEQTSESLRRPCGREKLGDGSLGALIAHTADNWERISELVAGGVAQGAEHAQPSGAHRAPRLLRALRHRHDDHGGGEYSAASADPHRIDRQLTSARMSLRRIATLTDPQLEAIPPAGSFRFCDGKRTLEQVMSALLKHQEQQLEAIRSAARN